MTAADYKWPDKITLASGSGVGVTVISSWGELLGADSGTPVRIALTANTAERMKWVGLGLADLTAGGTGNSGMLLEGDGPYAARFGHLTQGLIRHPLAVGRPRGCAVGWRRDEIASASQGHRRDLGY